MTDPAGMFKVGFVLIVIGAEVILLGALVGMSASLTREAAPAAEENRALVSQLGLTDLALWSDARYTRHPSQADLFSAFSDHPSALEHVPPGSFTAPRAADEGPRRETPAEGVGR